MSCHANQFNVVERDLGSDFQLGSTLTSEQNFPPPSSPGQNSEFKGIMWGVNGHAGRSSGSSVYALENLSQQMQLIKQLGATHYRTDFYDPTQEQFDKFTKVLAAAKPYGIVVTPVLVGHEADTEQASYDLNYKLSKGFAEKFPEVAVFELGNEDNNKVMDPFQDGSLPATQRAQPKYVAIRGKMRGLLEGLRAGNPNAKAALGDSGGCGGYGWLQALWQDGLRWDITVMHPYDFWGDIDNRFSTGVHCAGGDNMIQKHADFGKPIWLTEFNYTPAVKNGDKLNEGKGLVKIMEKFNSIAKKYNIQSADIYELVDETDLQGAEAHFGIFDNAGRSTTASDAVETYLKANPSVVYP